MALPTPSPQLKTLFLHAKHHKLHKGQVLYSSDDRLAFFYLVKGYIKRYIIADDGSIRVQSIYAPGYIFPLTMAYKTLFDIDIYEGRETVYYDGLTDVEVYKLDEKALLDATAAEPLLYRDFLHEAGRRFHSNIQWLENASLKSSYQRLAHRLVYLGQTFGNQTALGLEISVPLTHQDMADILNMARETVSRHLAELVELKLVQTGGKIVILDMSGLLAQIKQS